LTRLADLGAPLARVPMATPHAAVTGTSQAEAQVVIRLFAVDDGTTVSVLAGGTGRVLAEGDDPRLPTACVAKDVWVVGGTVAPVIVGPRLPQVDFGGSLPTRAADALYWTNRSAERAEAMARTVGAVVRRLEQDPGLAVLDEGAWARRMIAVLRAIRHNAGVPAEPGSANPLPPDAELGLSAHGELTAELGAVPAAIAHEIGALLTEATTVREYLSTATGRVLADLAELRAAISSGSAGIHDLFPVLGDFAAFAGLWHESIVRGPAWRIGDTGRRLERALVVLDLVEAAVAGMGVDAMSAPAACAGSGVADDVYAAEIEAGVIEVLLSANESLVAYRRRYRSDVEFDATIALLIHDATNPRSLVSAIDLLERHAVDGDWQVGVELAVRARQALTLPLAELLPATRAVIEEIGLRVVERWFSSPVAPILMRPTDLVCHEHG
ncbi:MAG TPA: alpha-E domain-containing protein, partial [Ilumatobacteraceae bacterium]|nr:alpha-E domain-containing protein [Ilumatobacteraceae bacterium]